MAGLLLVLAHPDDECFFGGGVLARYARQGVPTALLTLTDGQAGRMGAGGRLGTADPKMLGPIRREELKRAAKVLGIHELIMPGWLDGGLKDVPDEVGIALVIRWVRALQPEVLISFGPEGGVSGHPDHRAAWRWTDAAFDRAADPEHFDGLPSYAPAKFYWITWPEAVPDLRGIPGSLASAILDVGKEIDHLKREAFAEHATQQDHRALFNRFQDALQGREYFHLAKSRVKVSSELETDLMAGIPDLASGLPSGENAGYSTPKERECS